MGPIPKETLRQRIRRWRRSLAVFSPLTRWLITWGLGVALLDLGLFAATAVWAGDAGDALTIALTIKSPFATDADLTAVPLAVLTVLLVPAFVGSIVALAVEGQLRAMTRSQRSADKLVEKLANRQREKTEGERSA